jgi:hypothetical protein
MKWLESRILWGGLLILGGILFLLQNLGILELGDLFWALLLGLAGVFFLSVFFQNRSNWWALIPGFTLLGVAVLVATSWLAPRVASVWGGSIVLGSIGLSFLVIYLLERKNWWAIIPTGVMLSLAIITGLGEIMPNLDTGGIFLLGLGATFALLALLPSPEGKMKWAWIPAGVLALIGLSIMAAEGQLINYILPLVLILVGGFMILRILLRRPR